MLPSIETLRNPSPPGQIVAALVLRRAVPGKYRRKASGNHGYNPEYAKAYQQKQRDELKSIPADVMAALRAELRARKGQAS